MGGSKQGEAESPAPSVRYFRLGQSGVLYIITWLYCGVPQSHNIRGILLIVGVTPGTATVCCHYFPSPITSLTVHFFFSRYFKVGLSTMSLISLCRQEKHFSNLGVGISVSFQCMVKTTSGCGFDVIVCPLTLPSSFSSFRNIKYRIVSISVAVGADY